MTDDRKDLLNDLDAAAKLLRAGDQPRLAERVAYAASLLEMRPEERWIKAGAATNPPFDTLVIAWSDPYGPMLADRTTNNPDFGWSCDGKVTHWMPLPSPPMNQGSGSGPSGESGSGPIGESQCGRQSRSEG